MYSNMYKICYVSVRKLYERITRVLSLILVAVGFKA